MRSRYDAQARALYLRFAAVPIVESEEVYPGLIVDFDADDRIVTIEILDVPDPHASERRPRASRENGAAGED
ncbi:DUF2283 domain-containing protein [Methylobacterium sp. Gmos1]